MYQSARAIIKSSHVEPLKLPARSPNLNAYAERWVRSVKEEALSKLNQFSEASLKRVLSEYVVHFHAERNHQGKGNVLLFPTAAQAKNQFDGPVSCKERLGGLLNLWDKVALKWAREVSEHPAVVERAARYIAIHRELKREPPGPRRSALVDGAFALKKTAIPLH